jgi:ATP-binding cassette subfamily F protein 3
LHEDLLSFDTNDSIVQVAMTAFERVLELEKKLRYSERTGKNR